ncbi:hypothetical protein [Candidatus Nitrosocosmicus sp. R]|jgi:hypothetical protein
MIQKIRSSINTYGLLSAFSISMFVLVMFAFDHSNYTTVFFIPNAYAINNTEAIGGLATTVDLGSPFFVQIYSHDPAPPKSESEPNLYVNHTNDGIINGNLSVVHVGNDTETLRNNNTVHLQGNYSLTSHNGMDTASYNFQGIGTYGPNDTYESKGVAIFDEVATGELSSLANSIAVYKVKVDANDNGAFLMWHWK